MGIGYKEIQKNPHYSIAQNLQPNTSSQNIEAKLQTLDRSVAAIVSSITIQSKVSDLLAACVLASLSQMVRRDDEVIGKGAEGEK